MSARALIRDLEQLGIVVAANGGRIVLSGPSDALTDDLVARLRSKRAELLAALSPAPCADEWTAEDQQARFEELAAVLEFDGGLPREWAEAMARLETFYPAGSNAEQW